MKDVVYLLDLVLEFQEEEISISHRLPAPEDKIPPIIHL